MPVSKLRHKGVEIIYIDHRKCSESEMIQNLFDAEKIILCENKAHFQLINGTDTYATPNFMKQANIFGTKTKNLMTKGAYIGLSGMKIMLFQAYNLLTGGKLKAFASEAEALDYLAQK